MRATRDLDAGSEILINYDQQLASHDSAQQNVLRLGNDGCDCKTCREDTTAGGANLAERVRLLEFVEKPLMDRLMETMRKPVRGNPPIELEVLPTIHEHRSLLAALDATYPPNYDSLRPTLSVPCLAISNILSLQFNSPAILLSIDFAISDLRCTGFVFYDTSPTTMEDISSPMLIDFNRSDLRFGSTYGADVFYSILYSLERLGLKKRRESWVRTFKRLEEILSGGGEEYFQFRHSEKLAWERIKYVFGLFDSDLMKVLHIPLDY